MFIQAIMIGMNYDQFWHDDPNLFFIYSEAHNRKEKDKMLLMDYQAWLHGMYIDYALAVNHPLAKKKGDYLKEPITVSQREKEAPRKMTDEEREEYDLKQAELLFNQFGKYAEAYNKQYSME